MSLTQNNNNGQSDEILSNNEAFIFAQTKAERLSAAVHMITRFMNSDEPLRQNLRKESIKLLSRIFILEEGDGDSIQGIISRIISLLDISYRTQYISEMNWKVIRSEFVSFGEFFESRNLGAAPGAGNISTLFFNVPQPKAIAEAKPEPEVFEEPDVVKDKVISKGQPAVVKKTEVSKPVVREKKNGRRDAILKLLKKQNKITVRDAVSVIPNVSEKTIQRELISMVKAGILLREGERRWSTYSIA